MTDAEQVQPLPRDEMRAIAFTRLSDGTVELSGGAIWPEWMHIDVEFLVDVRKDLVRIEDGHILFTLVNTKAEYTISGLIKLHGRATIVADRVG